MHNLRNKNNYSDEGGEDSGNEDCPGRDVLGPFDILIVLQGDGVTQKLDGGIDHLSQHNDGDGHNQIENVIETNLEIYGGKKDQGGDNEMNADVGLGGDSRPDADEGVFK